MCDEAQRAHDKGDMRTFFNIRRSLCPKPKSSPTFVMDGSDVCVYYKDIRCAFRKCVCALLDARIVTHQEALDEIIKSIDDYHVFDIPIPPKHVMYDIVEASELWNARGRHALTYSCFALFPQVFDIYIMNCFNAFVLIDLLLSGVHPFCRSCRKTLPLITFEGLP